MSRKEDGSCAMLDETNETALGGAAGDRPEICKQCLRSLRRVSGDPSYCGERHPQPDWAQKLVDKLDEELRDRRLGWGRYIDDDEILGEIENALADIIRAGASPPVTAGAP